MQKERARRKGNESGANPTGSHRDSSAWLPHQGVKEHLPPPPPLGTVAPGGSSSSLWSASCTSLPCPPGQNQVSAPPGCCCASTEGSTEEELPKKKEENWHCSTHIGLMHRKLYSDSPTGPENVFKPNRFTGQRFKSSKVPKCFTLEGHQRY